MNRNVESHFAYNPTNIDISRSRFDMSFTNKTSFNVGDLIPLCRPIEVLPGDTFSVDTSKVVRLQTLLKPVMDNLYLDTYWFFVPNRLVWKHWKEFMGENTQSAWLPSTTYQIPTISSGDGWPLGSIADHMGLPIGIALMAPVSQLPFRGYALICNEWFRSENLTDPLVVPDGDASATYSSSATEANQPALGGTPFKACKYFDYFTAALPAPQRGPNVQIPMEATGNNNGWIPVAAFDAVHVKSANVLPNTYLRGFVGYSGEPSKAAPGVTDVGVMEDSGGAVFGAAPLSSSDQAYGFHPSNLWAQGSNFTCDINSLRLAFQIQKLYEKDARGGTRYIEVLKSHFGVTSPDSRLQRPEYLGGNRIPITVNEVVNNASPVVSSDEGEGPKGVRSVNGSPLGDLAGMSKTTDIHSDFTHSFTEHGYIFCLGVARYDHSYQQGIHKSWLRKDRLDFYWPVLANIGEQPILKREIFATPSDTVHVPPQAGEIFGYQEAWAEYRYAPDMITGMMRSALANGLDSWHFGDMYSEAPTLSDSWIREDKTNVDRTLAVTSDEADQLFADFYFNIKASRCMPVYSIPGLIDHH